MDLKQFELGRNIQALLRYHRSIGIVDYLQGEEISRFMQIQETSSTEDISRHLGRQESDVQEQTQSATVDSAHKNIKLSDIRDEISTCSFCDLAAQRRFPSAGSGSIQAKLFIVGEWLSVPDGVEDGVEILFGVEEDQMLSKMIAAINLKKSDTFITNSIKCGLRGSSTPTGKNFQSCLPFLHRQISLVQPDVICAMGTTVAQILLKSNRSLSQLRGRFHNYKEGNQGSIPLMVTYHPTYLLKNKEMKKITWVDLQAIGKRIDIR